MEVLPLVDDGNLVALEFPVEPQFELVVEQADMHIALAVGLRAVHVDIVVGLLLWPVGYRVVVGADLAVVLPFGALAAVQH